MAVLFVFFDGLGVGDSGPDNPLAHATMPWLRQYLAAGLTSDSATFMPTADNATLYQQLDACLEIDGLPQSATGQSTLLTGINAAKHMTRHYGPQPGPTLRKLLKTNNLFLKLRHQGKKVCLSNFYPQKYRDALQAGTQRPNAILYAAQCAGLRQRDAHDYQNNKAVAADLTGAHTEKLFATTQGVIGAFAMGQRLADLAQHYDFTFFDGWIADVAGHRWEWSACLELLKHMDKFLAGILSKANNLTVLLTSDHGNIEAKDKKSHTYNPVPLLVWGQGAIHFTECTSLCDVAPAIHQCVG